VLTGLFADRLSRDCQSLSDNPVRPTMAIVTLHPRKLARRVTMKDWMFNELSPNEQREILKAEFFHTHLVRGTLGTYYFFYPDETPAARRDRGNNVERTR
jgi:hypothetical protein